MKKNVLLMSVIFTLLFVAACGSVATPPPSSADLTEAAAHAGEEDHTEEGEEETVEEVAQEPTETPVPPTETPEPPTATVAPTEAPTEEVTEEATEEPAEEPASSASNDPIVRLVELTGNAERGDEIFHATYDTASGPYACSVCHSVEPDVRLIGPSLWDIRETAATRVEGESWAQYIYHSIVAPNDYIVEADPAYPEGLMPQNYEEILSDQDIYNIIAYLATLTDSE